MPLVISIVLFFVWFMILAGFLALFGLTGGNWPVVMLLGAIAMTFASNFFYGRYQMYSGLPDEHKSGFVGFVIGLQLGWLNPARWFTQSVADDGSDPPLGDVLSFLVLWGFAASILSNYLWTWVSIVLGAILGFLAMIALYEYVDFDEVTPSINRFLRNAISAHPLGSSVSRIVADKGRAAPLDGEMVVRKIVERISQSSWLPVTYRLKRNQAQELANHLTEANKKLSSENAELRRRLEAHINLDADLRGIVEAGAHLRWIDDAQKALVKNLARKHGMKVDG
jgi:membrane protein implicated in regulation of membrane protease activity